MAKELSAEQKEKKSRFSAKTVIVILLLLNMLVAGGIAGYFFLLNPADSAPKPPEMATSELGEMLINLADPGGIHYLRFTAVMEYPKEEKELVDELQQKNHVIKDTVIRLLRSKKLAEVQPPESIDNVQREMTEAINEKLEHGKLSRIYFTEYLTQ
ncbi:flagellar basal body-associated FliL family protein [Peptococcaceae bacterium 1198_IL3148]